MNCELEPESASCASSPPASSASCAPAPRVAHLAVLGTGLFGRALAQHVRAHAPSLRLSVASRSTALTPADAVAGADAVVLALPPAAYPALLPAIRPRLRRGALLIDVSNRPLGRRKDDPPSPALALQKLAPGARVVKALNTLSAAQLMGLPRVSARLAVPYAADDALAVAEMDALLAALGFAPRHWGPVAVAAPALERLPHELFPSYRAPLGLAAAVWAWWIAYTLLASFVLHGRAGRPRLPWDRAPFVVCADSTGETSMTLFALVFLAGPVARLLQLARGSVSRPFGRFMAGWLDMRKELGLIAFGFAALHVLVGALARRADGDDWKAEMYSILGSFGDSFASSMSWAEFRAVFSWLGCAALALGAGHQALWGVVVDQRPRDWAGGGAVMPSYWLGLILPALALLLRALTWTPCVAFPLKRLEGAKRTPEAKGEEEV